jgi:hypothetical protein
MRKGNGRRPASTLRPNLCEPSTKWTWSSRRTHGTAAHPLPMRGYATWAGAPAAGTDALYLNWEVQILRSNQQVGNTGNPNYGIEAAELR